MLPLEQRILQAVIGHTADGVHGFALAHELAQGQGVKTLTSHGTLYKALDRLRTRGFLVAQWEDPEAAAEAGRPRRRLYRITAEGRLALQGQRLKTDPVQRWREAPA